MDNKTQQEKTDEKERKRFLDSVSVSELSPEEAELVLMRLFPKKVVIDIVLED